MKNTGKCYLAGTGMITSVGANSMMNITSVNAGISGYQLSEFYTRDDDNITMALMPDEVFSKLQLSEKIDEGLHYCEQYDHIIKMAVIALREVLRDSILTNPVPLLLSMPDSAYPFDSISSETLLSNLLKQSDLCIDSKQIRNLYAGRAGGIIQLELAARYLHEKKEKFVLVGGSDSHCYDPLISMLDETERLLTPSNSDGFAAGEGAAFLLLTADPNKAINHNGHIITIHVPGIAEEPGSILNEEPYKGDGLDAAFKKAMAGYTGPAIRTIYSSMNGEHYWAKEFAVAYTRNQQYIQNEFNHQHPADCFGDLGAATGPALIILAANQLLKQSESGNYLVYCSSDSTWRAAVRLEKMAFSG